MSSVSRWSIVAAMATTVALGTVSLTHAQSLAAQEKEECTRNLKAIYQAIEAYQLENKDIPNWLSDLVPKYLTDVNLLICPVCRRTGKTESPLLADPKIASSYLFEFCPAPAGLIAPGKTRRDWKRRQMGLVGSVVPIVRCRNHDPLLNLSFDGRVYESPGMWETLLTNRFDPAKLTMAALLTHDSAARDTDSEKVTTNRQYPLRDPKTRKQLLDLSPFYNAMLTDSWHGNKDNDLGALPAGVQTLGGTDFDARGIIQLGGKSRAAEKFPSEVKGIPVHQKCQRLQFLHAAGFGGVADEGKPLGSYVVHYAANQMRLEIPITYGHEMRNWHSLLGEPPAPPELKVAWTGDNGISRRANSKLRLFITTWTNVVPNVEIESIDFDSSMTGPAPFLLAITAE